MKHVIPYKNVSESIGRGSVILIKGVGSAPKLYATYVTGVTILKSGAKMLFLSDEFYRIKMKDGKLVPVRINFRSESALTAALNFRSTGRISVVTNHNKTPFHWKTLNHTNIFSALRELQEILMFDEFLFESEDQIPTRNDVWNEFTNYLGKKVYRTLFEEANDVDIFEYSPNLELTSFVENTDETSTEDIDWGFSVHVFDRSEKIEGYLDALDINQPIFCDFLITTQVTVEHTRYPGSYDEPSHEETEIIDLSYRGIELWIAGAKIDPDEELKGMLDELLSTIKNKEMDDEDLHRRVSKQIRKPLYLKGA